MKKIVVFCCTLILFTGLQANASPISVDEMDSGIYFSTTHIKFTDIKENAGYESDFGLFSMADPTVKYQIFNYKKEPNKSAVVNVSNWAPLADGFGFYFDVHTGGKNDPIADYTWYSDPSLNQLYSGISKDTDVEHVLTYFANGYIYVSLDDQLGGGDRDFDDMIIKGKSRDINSIPVAPVPEPATMVLFGTGLAALAGLRHIKKKK